MKIVILCSDGPHNKYLISKINENFNSVKIFVESGEAQLKWKLKNEKYKQYIQLKYQLIRRKLYGSERYRRNFFKKYIPNFQFSNYDVVFVDNINEKTVTDGLSEYEPDIAIVMGTSILHKKVLRIMDKKDIVNIHGGFLPYYKGNHCFFFAFYNKDYDKIGSTLHFINSGIDTGDIIEMAIPVIEKKDTPESLYCKAEKLAMDRLVVLLKEYQLGKELPRHKQEPIGKLFYTKDRKLHYDIALFFRRIKGEKN